METGFDLKEFDRMMNNFEDLKITAMKQSKRIVTRGAEIVLAQQKKDAPKNSGKSYKALKITETKLYKTSVYAKIGIGSDNWEQTKALWFQHFGYFNYGLGGIFNGMFIAVHAGWMNKSFDRCKAQAYNEIYKQVSNIKFDLK